MMMFKNGKETTQLVLLGIVGLVALVGLILTMGGKGGITGAATATGVVAECTPSCGLNGCSADQPVVKAESCSAFYELTNAGFKCQLSDVANC
jgi:hypothetical protein